MATPSVSLTREVNDALHRGSSAREIHYLDTATAYDLWAEVYDTDGNFLQALDNIEMETLLPRAISILASSSTSSSADAAEAKFKAVDLGCGTGRNTLQILNFPQITDVVALDLSPKMLEIAQRRCLDKISSLETLGSGSLHSPRPRVPHLTFAIHDMIATPDPPAPATSPLADLVVSTLVLEHIPLATFFATVSRILAPGGLLVLTNMHAEMGGISQAGFVDPRTGDKIRPTSYAHTVADVVAEAEQAGLEVVPDLDRDGGGDGLGVKEVQMREDLRGKLGVRSEKWIGVHVWFGALWRKKGGT